MSAKLLVCCLARNEANRFLPSALEAWGNFADEILFLDDASTDDTPKIALDAGCTVHYREGGAWGNESPARQQLFDLALQHTEYGDWILLLDADMVPANDPRELAFGGHSGGWAFPLYDLWQTEPLRYRCDGYWRGHDHPRIWMIRRPAMDDYVWSTRGIHTGHFPANLHIDRGVGIAPMEYGLIHYAYSNTDLRITKHRQYIAVKDQLSEQERRHADSILDPEPLTLTLPFVPKFTLKYEGNRMKDAA